jgi:membrane-bound lytic murein transglycosylase D
MRSFRTASTGEMMRRRACTFAAGLAVLAAAIAAPAEAASLFEVPPALQQQVDFWRDIFAVYSKQQVVLHDTERLDRVYGVLDFSDLAGSGLSDVQIEIQRRQTVDAEIERVRAVLLSFHQGFSPRNAEEKRIFDLFRGDRSPHRFLQAAEKQRLRSQTGLRDRFAEGISVGHRYFRDMERIFAEEGVPLEITRLPLVESTFNLRAYSKVGAAGIWQFMPATARMFSLRIDDAVDERLDPLAATRAAARFLRQSYRSLGTWPLAIMAYNHGPGGIARAVRALGTTDESTIIRRYDGPAFKFASRNFYPEFLAALEVERNAIDYYGPLPQHRPHETDVVEVPRHVSAEVVTRCTGTTSETISELNPSLLAAVHSGKQRIPAGYRLHVPAGSGRRLRSCYASLPAEERPRVQKRQVVLHRVRRGQTLAQIARRYGSTVEEIKRHNGLRSKDQIRTGQVLRVPAG